MFASSALNHLSSEMLPDLHSSFDGGGSKSYSYISTDKGVFLFAVDGVEPFLDGHKILLRIGNPMNMTFSGFKLKVRYGKRPPVSPSFESTSAATNSSPFLKSGRSPSCASLLHWALVGVRACVWTPMPDGMGVSGGWLLMIRPVSIPGYFSFVPGSVFRFEEVRTCIWRMAI